MNKRKILSLVNLKLSFIERLIFFTLHVSASKMPPSSERHTLKKVKKI